MEQSNILCDNFIKFDVQIIDGKMCLCYNELIEEKSGLTIKPKMSEVCCLMRLVCC